MMPYDNLCCVVVNRGSTNMWESQGYRKVPRASSNEANLSVCCVSRIVLADFDELPDAISGVNAPVVQVR